VSPAAGTIRGRCHCGRIGYRFDTALALEALPLRRCACSFCRRHGARTTSDAAGSVRFEIADAAALRRYRFGLRSADFLLCGKCGTYLAAVIETDAGAYATLNANCFEQADLLLQEAPLVVYEGETLEQRMARRQAKWTPVAGMI
jgi:hypothetical protein